jgi:hypothetical protein
MTSILPLKIPYGDPIMLDIKSFGAMLVLFILLSVAGLILGTLYFSIVSQAALSGEINWRQQLIQWPRSSVQTTLLTLAWAVLIIGISLPASCVISVVALMGIAMGQCAVLVYSGLLIWTIFPLLFSPHGIFVSKDKAWTSIKRGFRITRMTLPATSLFFLSIFLLTQLLDLLWRIPPEDSWLMFIGVAGHAFVATGFLAASFIYYDQADKWIKSMQNQNIPVTNT